MSTPQPNKPRMQQQSPQSLSKQKQVSGSAQSKPTQSPSYLIKTLMERVRRLQWEKKVLLKRMHDLLKVVNKNNKVSTTLRTRMTLHPKTGLPNHLRMDADLTKYFSETDSSKYSTGAILLLHLDEQFDIIQRTLKPQMSEWILYQIGARIHNMFQGKGVYHTRENEFLVLLEGKYSKDDIEKIAKTLHKEVSQPHIFSGYNVHISSAIGISLFPSQGYNKSYLLQNADIALQWATNKDDSLALYESSMRDQVVERMDLQNSIVRALEVNSYSGLNDQFSPYYQPIFRIQKNSDGSYEVVERLAEALIRWKHPRLGMVNPQDFIPLAEETGLIVPIGTWMLYQVAAQIQDWNARNIPVDGVSVNVSPRQMHSDQVEHNISKIIKLYQIKKGQLKLEITESTLIDDPHRIIDMMKSLYNLGITFSLDDFGTGYSSLSYVHQLPAGHLKIDKSFVFALSQDERARAIIRAIIAMGKELGFELIAEGIESKDQLEFLLNEGVNYFQGFLFSTPIPPEDFEKLIIQIVSHPLVP
jgi:EAL domain-containing protein (putative c-di-GMP-specific phosphodiesterase class I)/GGDEF domain-containing protein